MEASGNTPAHVELKHSPLRFSAGHKQVFFDGHSLLFVHQGRISKLSVSSRLEEPINVKGAAGLLDSGPVVIAAKLSLDQKYLALQRQPTQIEFFFIAAAASGVPGAAAAAASFVLNCQKGARILGFHWTFVDNFFLVTDLGIEFYQFPTPGKRPELKLIKHLKHTLDFFVYSPRHRLALLACGAKDGTTILGYHFTQNSCLRIPKFVIERGTDNGRDPLRPGELVVAQLYGKLFCLHLHQRKQQVALYQLTKEVIIHRLTVKLPCDPPPDGLASLFVHTVDNLLLIHHSYAKVTLLYDIKDRDCSVPIASALPMALARGARFEDDLNLASEEDDNAPAVQLYSTGWEFQMPNFVLDREQGCLWEVALNLETLALGFPSKKKLVDFLLRRSRSKTLLLRVIRSVITECDTLEVIADMFDMLNNVLGSSQPPAQHPGSELDQQQNLSMSIGSVGPLSQAAAARLSAAGLRSPGGADDWSSSSSSEDGNNLAVASPRPPRANGQQMPMSPTKLSPDGYVIVSQEDMYTHVLLPVEEEKGLDHKYVVAVLTEYIRSLNFHHIKVDTFLYELLINFLVRNGRFWQLHQLLQYHVISDSVHVACQLLSLETSYAPAYQLALDMFKRLHTNNEIVEVLLTKNFLVAALRFIRNHKDVKVGPYVVRFLEAASSPRHEGANDWLGSPARGNAGFGPAPPGPAAAAAAAGPESNVPSTTLFYHVYRFFDERSEVTEQCLPFTQKFKALFPSG